jgi:hypothetical protein
MMMMMTMMKNNKKKRKTYEYQQRHQHMIHCFGFATVRPGSFVAQKRVAGAAVKRGGVLGNIVGTAIATSQPPWTMLLVLF